MNKFDEDFGKEIREIRKYKGWTQDQLADASGLSKKTIQKFEYNNRNSKIETVIKICRALRIDLKWGVNNGK